MAAAGCICPPTASPAHRCGRRRWRYGHHPDDVAARRAAAPWYTTKTEPSFEDMLAKLRRTIIAAGFLPEPQGQPTSQQIAAVHRAWASAAA